MDQSTRFPKDPAAYAGDKLAGTLAQLFDEAVAATQWRIDYYGARGSRFSLYARTLRRLALLLFILGTLTPMLGLLFGQLGERWGQQATGWGAFCAVLDELPMPDLGYLFLALAAGFVLYDQFFGTSRSWMRFRQSEAKLQVMLTRLRYAWASELTALGGVLAGSGDARRLTKLLGDHATAVESLAEAETREWAEQFRAQIDAFDQKVKMAQAEATARPDKAPSASERPDKPDSATPTGRPPGYAANRWKNGHEEGLL